jgi:predicted 3-demethylubiquinone-9 3-methyltransferase (glyoxalase superfamily)
MNKKITPCLWFDYNAGEALNFYTSIFKNSRIGEVSRYGEGGPGPAGEILTAMFELEGQEFMVLNGGPQYKLNEAISLYVDCETQEEVDRLWDKLTADGGEESMCGWLKDRFGLSWQIVPRALPEALSNPDPAKAKAAMDAMLQMQKIDIQKIQDAVANA